MLFLVGLGLGDATDITVKGLEVVRQADKLYLEHYTSLLHEEDYIKRLVRGLPTMAEEFVEEQVDVLLNEAKNSQVAFLVVGDPLGATTHTDLILRAVKEKVPYKIIHNASIMNAVGCCGLQLYSFGETVSIPLWSEGWTPDSFIEKILENKKRGLHTLCLLDIKVKEKSMAALMRGKVEYEPPRFMTVAQASEQILESLIKRKDSGAEIDLLDGNSKCIGLARVGSDDEKIARRTLSQMSKEDLGKPLHCLVIEGNLHPLEVEMVTLFEK